MDTLYATTAPSDRVVAVASEGQELEPEILTKTTPSAYNQVNRNRLKIALLIVGGMVVGIGISNGEKIKDYFIRPATDTMKTDANTDTATTPAPTQSPIFNDDFTADKQIRDAYLDKSFEAIDTQRGRLDETAADGVLNDAKAENKSKGTPYEVYLMRRINRVIAEGRMLVGQGVDLSSSEGIRKGWIWLGQSKALLIAWKRVINLNAQLLADGKITPQYTATGNLAAVLENIVVAVERGAVVRGSEYEQLLRNQYQAEQEMKKQAELLKLQRQTEKAQAKSEGKTNGK